MKPPAMPHPFDCRFPAHATEQRPTQMTKKTKILHLTVKRHLTSGQRKQLSSEVLSVGNLENAEWHSLAYHTTERKEPFEKSIPFPLSLPLLRPLFAWLLLLKISKDYDAILVRHMPFDPFTIIFARFIRNRMPVHHAKATEELQMTAPGMRGKIAAKVESITGRSSVRHAMAVLGVTRELGEYECELFGIDKPHFHYPNGMHPDEVGLAPDEREESHCHVVFLCGKFSPWQGLDRLVDAVDQAREAAKGLTVHLIGQIDDEQRQQIDDLNLSDVIVAHGFLESEDYRQLLAKADVSIGSLAIDRRGMREAALLKIREMLAAGIPVASGHPDTAIPLDFPYHRVFEPLTVDGLLDFAMAMKQESREEIRALSMPYIEKLKSMRDLVAFLEERRLV